jgi:hypothetical protein
MFRPLAVIHVVGVLLAYLHVCSGCRAVGYYTTDGVTCIACSPGKISNLFGGATTCVNCGQGYYVAQSAANMCNTCLAGTYASGFGGTGCEICPAGKTSVWSLRSYVCLYCAPGSFSKKQAYPCTPCSAGYYAPEKNATACMMCTPGTYSNPQWQTVCQNCTLGQYSISQNASTGCAACSAGYYGTEEKATACMMCTTGTYSNPAGQSVCRNCTLGQYSISQNASTGCAACPTPLFCLYCRLLWHKHEYVRMYSM